MRWSTCSTGARQDRGLSAGKSDHPGTFLFSLAAFAACFLTVATAAGDERKAVDVLVAGPAARTEPMDHALEEPLGRLAVDVRLSHADAVDPKAVIDPSGPHAEAFVRVWVDLTAPNRVTVYFVDSAWERILVRHVPIEKDLDEVEREEIAQIIRSAVEALLGGAKLGVTREEARQELLPETPAPTPPAVTPSPPEPRPVRHLPPPARAPPLGVDVGAFYEGEVYGNALWHGPGLLAGAEHRGELGWGGRVTLQYRAPATLEGDALGARVQALALRGLARGTWSSGNFGALAAAGVGLDLTHTEPILVSSSAVAASSRWDAVPVARVLGGAGLRAAGIGFWPVVGLDVDLVQVRYVANGNTGKYTVFEVARARPFVGLELTLPVEQD